jgi:NADP-dependent 3-hydroxy acid dehydrogenase YdfG
MSDPTTPAVVTGAGRGFGRAIATALVAAGTPVVGVARDEQRLRTLHEELGDGFVPLVGDATDEELAREVVQRHRPGLLVLNAGATPAMAPIHEQTWESFGRAWEVDVRQAFTWIRTALTTPLAPGSTVVAMSSGAALAGSPLSGGYAGAKATVRFLASYAAGESTRAGLGIRVTALLPQLTPSTDLGAAAVEAYAAHAGVDRETFIARLAPALTAEQVAKAVVGLAADADTPATAYRLDAASLQSLD